MNCEDVSKIIDDGLVSKLTPAEQCEVHVHLAACADCASGWRAHRALERQTLPPTPPMLADRTLAALPARARTGVPRRGAAARLGAAAAVLAVGGAFAALSYVAQLRPSHDRAAARDAPVDAAHETGAVPVRSSGAETPLNGVERSPAAPPHQSAPRLPDGDFFMLLRVAPDYPLPALEEAREASVHLELTVSAHGTVEDIVVLDSSDPLFETSAKLAVERWKYMPRVVNGERVAVRGVHTIIHYVMAPPDEAPAPSAPALPPDRPPLKDLLVEAWDCAAARDFLCSQQVLDQVSAAYELTTQEQQIVSSFYGYLYTQYGDFERAIDAFERAAGDDPASSNWLVVMHLYFMRDQYQLALDTGTRFTAAFKERYGRPHGPAEQFVTRLEQLGIRPTPSSSGTF